MSSRRRSAPFQHWSTVDPVERNKTWIRVNEPEEEEHWAKRWTSLQLERDPGCITNFEKLINPRERKELTRPIDWTHGSHHRGVSKFLTYNLRGLNENTKNLIDAEGYVDLDAVMAEYVPNYRFTMTPRMLSEIIRFSEKNRFHAKVAVDQTGQKRVFIRANQGHFGNLAVDLNKTCDRITAENLPMVCLHATYYRYWRSINSNDEETNGLWPGGLEQDRDPREDKPRREVHAASIPPGMPGTTTSHLKNLDVIISIDIETLVRDGGVAYLSQNGVILFPERVPKKYLVEAFGRRCNRNLIHNQRSASQQKPPQTRSSREDDLTFRCMRCKSTDVDQAQNPHTWPGNETCA